MDNTDTEGDNCGMRFPPQVTRSQITCSVRGCTSRASRDSTVRFHLFPKPNETFIDVVDEANGSTVTIDRRLAWERALKMETRASPYIRICSLHFKEKDYCFPNTPSQKRYLKKIAIPSCNLPIYPLSARKLVIGKLDVKRKREPRTRNSKRWKQAKKQGSRSIDNERPISVGSNISRPTIEYTDDGEVSNSVSARRSDRYTNEAVKVDTNEELIIETEAFPVKIELVEPKIEFDETFKLSSNLAETETKTFAAVAGVDDRRSLPPIIRADNDGELRNLTGIERMSTLDDVLEILEIGDPESDSAAGKLSVRDRVLITYVKLRHDLPWEVLAVLFKCDDADYCRNTVFAMLDVLSGCLKFAIVWPGREELFANVPRCFEDVRVVLDRTEICVERPDSICCRIETRSKFAKSECSVKFMIGFTPGGSISFLGNAYGGITSDKAMLEQSNLIELLDRGDAIVVSGDFSIDDNNAGNERKAIRRMKYPFFQRDCQEILSEVDYEDVRTHIELFNRRLNDFRILRSELPTRLFERSVQILTVICATINLDRYPARDR